MKKWGIKHFYRWLYLINLQNLQTLSWLLALQELQSLCSFTNLAFEVLFLSKKIYIKTSTSKYLLLRNGCAPKTPAFCRWQWSSGVGGGHYRWKHHITEQAFAAGLTRQVRRWFDVRKRCSEKETSGRKQDNTRNERCVLESDPAHDSIVMWSGTGRGSNARTDCCWSDVIWFQEDTRGGLLPRGMSQGPKSSVILTPLFFLFFFLSRIRTHACAQASGVCPIYLRLPHSVNLIYPAMLPPTFLRFLILSCPSSIPFSLIFSLAASLSHFHCEPWVCHSAEQQHGCGSKAASIEQIKNGALVNFCKMENMRLKCSKNVDETIWKGQKKKKLANIRRRENWMGSWTK